MGGFDGWLDGFRRKAAREGISAHVLALTLDGLAPDPEVVARDRNQPERRLTTAEYLERVVSKSRIAAGRAALAARGDQLAAIAARYGVAGPVLVAIWGLESNYGAIRGDFPVIRSLATLAHDGRRRALFESELLAGLRIIQAGDAAPEDMRGSWAGAMGHTQFMATSFLEHAVDFDGDGRRDIWGDDPTDALASSAAYLAAHGWQADGDRVSEGAGNFEVLMSYNASRNYCLAVGLLAEAIAG